MERLSQLRMQNQELTMRQMVEEIHHGLFNIEQATIKFEVNRKTVKHWLDNVEQEALARNRAYIARVQQPPRRKRIPLSPRNRSALGSWNCKLKCML